MALAMLPLAALPPDDKPQPRHGKAEYFASGFPRALILAAAIGIAVTAAARLLQPQPLEQIGIGLVVSIVAW